MILGAAGCLALAWWQWTRFESNSGSFQKNLGYALQWPMFAGFVVYAYYKFVRYEDAPAATGRPHGRHRDPPKICCRKKANRRNPSR